MTPRPARPLEVGILRYGAGNVGSVVHALEASCASLKVRMVLSPQDGAHLDALVLPGVGSMPQVSAHLKDTGLDQLVWETVRAGIPVLGICLGMQLFFGASAEGGAGLGLLPGETVPLASPRVPHLGWARVIPSRPGRLLASWPAEGAYAYFAHSYAVRTPEERVVAWASPWEGAPPYPAVVEAPPLYGVQFHPERSGPAGASVLTSFLRLAVERALVQAPAPREACP
jgi:glutamine amidotransferase